MTTTRRWILIATSLLVAALGAVYAFVGWDTASRVFTVASALASVAAVGVAVWAALYSAGAGTAVTVSGTGAAEAGANSTAITGHRGVVQRGTTVKVDQTGDATTGDGGTAITGHDG